MNLGEVIFLSGRPIPGVEYGVHCTVLVVVGIDKTLEFFGLGNIYTRPLSQ